MKYIIIFFSALSIISCSDDNQTLPTCIDEISIDFQNEACPGSGDLTLWEFNGQDVYCFNPGTCVADGAAQIYDINCNLLCLLGGISGNTRCDGLDWQTNATLKETLIRY